MESMVKGVVTNLTWWCLAPSPVFVAALYANISQPSPTVYLLSMVSRRIQPWRRFSMDLGQILTSTRQMYQVMPCYATRSLIDQSQHLNTARQLHQRRTIMHMCSLVSRQGAEGLHVGGSPKPLRICTVTRMSAQSVRLTFLSKREKDKVCREAWVYSSHHTTSQHSECK